MEPIKLEPMLTVKEAADVMRVTVGTIYAWVREGQIAAVRIGQTVRIPREALPEATFSVVEEGEKDALARLFALLKDNPDPEIIDELEARARERDAEEERREGTPTTDAEILTLRPHAMTE